ncbi:MAG: cyclic nucleotide-binding domain-containing protein [Deltaproteobacteria bacterium]|nr:cyclic nucleotide-binding domain-containing protein [Deltaproteobacteria bacterium]
MARKVRDFRAEADRRFFEGDYLGSLRIYRTLVDVVPLDFDVRLRIGDALLAMGELQRAAQVYTAVARHSANAGTPLRAIIACKILVQLDPALAPALDGLAKLYAEDSPRIGKGVRPAPPDPDQEVHDSVGLERDSPPTQVLADAAQVAAAIDSVAISPEKLPPIPLLSELGADAFRRVVQVVRLVRLRPGELAIREGEPGTSFFVVARGQVRVFRHDRLGGEIDLARLAEGSIFGEMALVSASPRTASVQADGDVDLLELNREALAVLSKELDTVARALDKFTRERLLGNLLATNPLFRPFDRKQKMDLVRRFTAHDVAQGTVIIREGQEGRGLFLLLQGEVDITKIDGAHKVLLATLKGGEVFGEISLIQDEPTTATVTAARQATVMFLAREYFQRLIEAIPSVRAYFEGLAEERLLDTQAVLQGAAAEEHEMELTEDDLVLI